ncbi:hypothetical protein MMYC01_208302 [Madurella mycetomatis]|uniref:Rhodopsin domain-containing protein n=1 Tax=Madurella mycetomatis TaxID=100816 RepID=A0A175VVW3_9PEZI|nr:hypothetical protein MMYC01_208302 [Madurella mycetomatis]
MVTDPDWGQYNFTGNFTPPTNASFWPPIPPNPGRSLQPDIAACAVITFLISSTFVALRFYTRGWLNHILGASDWCILPALLCAAGVTASALEQVARGAGKHAWEVDIFGLPDFERAAWYGILFYNLSLVFSRISILLLYKRIFTFTWIKKAIQVALRLSGTGGLFWTTFVYCQPINLWWANAGLHLASDLVVMALPMPVLSSLKLPRRQKYAVVGVFALGFSVCVFSVVRLVALVDVTEMHSLDPTYTAAQMMYWTSVEVNAAISCACIMTLKPFIQRIFPRLFPSKGIRTQSLQWITPVTGSSSNNGSNIRNSRQSFGHAQSNDGGGGAASSNNSLRQHLSRQSQVSGSEHSQ